MALRTAGSLLAVFLCSVEVVQGQDGFTVSHTHQRVCVLIGSSVDLPCSYTHPRGQTVTDSGWFTRKSGGGWSHIQDQPEYAGRVEYRGDEKRDCTLRITDLRETDATTYHFKFQTGDSTAYRGGSDGVSLSVTDLKVTVPPSSFKQAATLTCSSSCPLTGNHGNPSYIWYEKGRRLQQTTSRQLSVIGYQAPSYSCAVEGHEDLRSPAVCVIRQICSRVTYQNRRVCALKGSSVDISCTYYSIPSVRAAFWFRPEQRDGGRDGSTPLDLAGDPEFVGRVRYSGREGRDHTLRITDLRESDAAEYRFMFTTRYEDYQWGASFPGSTLTVTGLQVKVTETEAQRVTLTCSSGCPLTGNHGNPSYTWYENGQRLQQTTSRQISVSSSSQDSYSCAVEGHEDLRSPAVYKPKSVRVSVSPSGDVVEGSSVTLSCSSDASPPVDSHTWYKEKVTWSTASGESYTITNITSEDRGRYSCEARNGVGERMSHTVSINVLFKPRRPTVSVSPSGDILEGSSVTLTCSSDASPPVDSHTWYKENVTLSKTSGHNYTITNITTEHSGGYYCEAQNEVGSATSDRFPVYVSLTAAASPRAPEALLVLVLLVLVLVLLVLLSVLAAGALLVLLCWSLKRRSSTGSDITGNARRVQPDPSRDTYTAFHMRTSDTYTHDPSSDTYTALHSLAPAVTRTQLSSDTYTALHMTNRSTVYDTLANVKDSTETHSSLDVRTRSYDTLAVVTQDQDKYDDVDQDEYDDVIG